MCINEIHKPIYILTKLLKCTSGKSKGCLVERSRYSKCCQPYHYHQFSGGTSQKKVVLRIPVYKFCVLSYWKRVCYLVKVMRIKKERVR